MGVGQFTIESLGPKGDGTHLGPRGRVFIERTAPGDEVKARVHKDENGISRGELLQVLTPSPVRQPAPCPHYESCGNCTLQHLSTEFYRQWKAQTVKEALRKLGVRPGIWLDPIFIGEHGRRRATFNAIKQKSRVRFGYYRRRSQEITNIDSCLVSDSRLLALRNSLAPFLGFMLREATPTDFFFQVVGGFSELVITGPLESKDVDDLQSITGLTRIGWRLTEKHKVTMLTEATPITTRFGSLEVQLPPAAFLQPTLAGETALSDAIMQPLTKEVRFADLFAGCGTFSGRLLEKGTVDAYESSPEAVNALNKAAAGKPLKAHRRDLVCNPLSQAELKRYDAVVFDPPRAGCPSQAMRLAASNVPTLISVSCNPATFARDARILCNGGYRLKSLKIIDQFLWSHHVEIVGVFQ